MKVWAISDLHIGGPKNRAALASIGVHRDDWLILAGDIAEKFDDIEFAFRLCADRFKKLVWVPGNHELWTVNPEEKPFKGAQRYDRLVDLCRANGVVCPEDPFPELVLGGSEYVIAPCFVLYDYSFGPDGYSRQQVLDWAWEHGIKCTDEYLLHCEPYADIAAWCADRVHITESRLGEIAPYKKIMLVNHYPLRREFIYLPQIERFIAWCGTRATEDWHRRFPIDIVVYGHLHTPYTAWFESVRLEEVSLGYHNQFTKRGTLNDHLRLVWPPPERPTTCHNGKLVIRRP